MLLPRFASVTKENEKDKEKENDRESGREMLPLERPSAS